MKKSLINKIFYPLIILLALNCGCAARRTQIKEEAYPQESHLIQNVPFYKQSKNTCGPAALASVLGYWKIPFNYAELVEEIYSPQLKGSLDFEISSHARKFHLWSKYYQANPTDLRKKIKQDIPLIVVQKESLLSKNYHYVVVFGFDDMKREFVAHTGRKAEVSVAYNKFMRMWEGADFGTILICPAEKVTWQLDAAGFIYLGYLLEKKGFLDRALDAYLRAVALKPEAKIAHFNLGNVYFKMNDFSRAEDAFKKAIQLDSNFADAYNNLACVYLNGNKNLDEAEKLVQAALKLNPEAKEYYLDTLNRINEARAYGTK